MVMKPVALGIYLLNLEEKCYKEERKPRETIQASK